MGWIGRWASGSLLCGAPGAGVGWFKRGWQAGTDGRLYYTGVKLGVAGQEVMGAMEGKADYGAVLEGKVLGKEFVEWLSRLGCAEWLALSEELGGRQEIAMAYLAWRDGISPSCPDCGVRMEPAGECWKCPNCGTASGQS